jgi:hypothetical protein
LQIDGSSQNASPQQVLEQPQAKKPKGRCVRDPVWQHFEVDPIPNKGEWQCKMCKQRFKYKCLNGNFPSIKTARNHLAKCDAKKGIVDEYPEGEEASYTEFYDDKRGKLRYRKNNDNATDGAVAAAHKYTYDNASGSVPKRPRHANEDDDKGKRT